jgi:predicted porin
MKKTVIAIAVVAALAPAAAMADNANITFYGRVHLSVDSVSGVAANKNNLNVNDNSSRFGLKGSDDLGNGMKGLYQLESGASASAGSTFSGIRDSYLGLSGGFGTVLVGRLPGANQFVYDSNLFADQLGDAANFTNAGVPGRLNKAIAYATPDMGGLSALVSFVPAASVNSTTGGATGGNSFGLKLNYAANGITGNFGYYNVVASNTTTLKPISVAGSFDMGNGALVSAQFVRAATDVSGTTTTQNIFNVGGKFGLSDAAALKAQFSKAGATSGATNGATMLAVGVDYSLTKRTGVYAVFSQVSNDAGAKFVNDNWGHEQSYTGGIVASEKPSGFGVGLTHNF